MEEANRELEEMSRAFFEWAQKETELLRHRRASGAKQKKKKTTAQTMKGTEKDGTKDSAAVERTC
jgi:hypothetical protein